MARNEADHEDLMRELVSLVMRVECRQSSGHEPSIAGFNSLGWLFVYLGSDPMYRFDEQGRLRRAFVDGKLLRTTGQTLAIMERHGSSESTNPIHRAESTLLRRDLSSAELEAFRKRMRKDLDDLSEVLRTGEITRQHPADDIGLIGQLQKGFRVVLDSREFLAPAIVKR